MDTNYVLILDDTRSIEDVLNLSGDKVPLDMEIVLCKDFKEAQMQMVKSGRLAAHVCFDWNLYGSKNHMDLTGLDFAHWLSGHDEYRKSVLTDDFTFTVHSSDEVKAKEIFDVMKEHQEYKLSQNK